MVAMLIQATSEIGLIELSGNFWMLKIGRRTLEECMEIGSGSYVEPGHNQRVCWENSSKVNVWQVKGCRYPVMPW